MKHIECHNETAENVSSEFLWFLLFLNITIPTIFDVIGFGFSSTMERLFASRDFRYKLMAFAIPNSLRFKRYTFAAGIHRLRIYGRSFGFFLRFAFPKSKTGSLKTGNGLFMICECARHEMSSFGSQHAAFVRMTQKSFANDSVSELFAAQ